MPSPTPAALRLAYIETRRGWERQFRGGQESHYLPGPMWDGGEHHGKKYQSVWPKIATFLAQRHYAGSAVDYIEAIFRQTGLDRPPAPNYFLSEAAWVLYEKRPVVKDLLRQELASQATKANVEILLLEELQSFNVEQATIQVLLNADLRLSPLFRYCVATSLKTPAGQELAQQLLGQALKQFQTDPAGYRLHWRDVLPTKLANLAPGGPR